MLYPRCRVSQHEPAGCGNQALDHPCRCNTSIAIDGQLLDQQLGKFCQDVHGNGVASMERFKLNLEGSFA